jgi:hypothetical protein
MADQKRWFKVWTSLIVDMDALPNDVIGAWTRLGCRAALVGSQGRVIFTGWAHLARFWNVTVDDAQRLASLMPNVCVTVDVEEGTTRYGELTVTLKNWLKYQEDSTVAARMRALRSKRRGDKRRKEENPPLPPQGARPDVLSNDGSGGSDPEVAAQLRALADRIGRPP